MADELSRSKSGIKVHSLHAVELQSWPGCQHGWLAEPQGAVFSLVDRHNSSGKTSCAGVGRPSSFAFFLSFGMFPKSPASSHLRGHHPGWPEMAQDLMSTILGQFKGNSGYNMAP